MMWRLGQWDQLEKFFPLRHFDKQAVNQLQLASTKVGIACSGGPDSLCLLLLFRLYWPEKPCILLHYNHRIRAESDAEEQQIRALARQLNIPCAIGHRPDAVGTSEEELRRARYTFFQKILRLHRSKILLLGHHQDDLFETVLMRLLRGSSLQGLIAPRAIQDEKFYVKIRPLLPFSKRTIQEACSACQIGYFVDKTNAEDGCRRNRFRHHVLPAIASACGDNSWRTGWARSCTILAEQRDYLTTLLREKFSAVPWEEKTLKRTFLQDLKPAELRYFFQIWWQQHGITEIHFSRLDQLLEAIRSRTNLTVNLDERTRIVCDPQYIKLEQQTPTTPPLTFKITFRHGQVFFPNRARLTYTTQPFSPQLYQDLQNRRYSHQQTAILDLAILHDQPLYLRPWQPGDSYVPLGHIHPKKVKTLWVNGKFSKEEKVLRPVICNQRGEILWIPGLPPAEMAKVHPHAKFCVFLIYQFK